MTVAASPEPSDPEPQLLATALGPVAVTQEGEEGAVALLCIHGIPGSRRDFRYLAPALSGRCRVVRIEMPGFGASPPSQVRRLSDWGRLLTAVAEALDLPRYHLLGHSFGGGGALLAARLGGRRVLGVVLLSSMGVSRHRAFAVPPRLYGVARAGLSNPVTRRLVTRLARAAYQRMGLPPPAASDTGVLDLHLSLLASVRFRTQRRAARELQVPALVVHAGDDRLVEVGIARELAALMPRGELLELRSGGHHLQRTRVEEVATAVSGFLSHIDT